MLGIYILTVLATLLWGLWFLYFPCADSGDPLGLKVRNIIVVILLAFIPGVNAVAVIITFIWVVVSIIADGPGSVFPSCKGTKIDNFFNYEFFKKQ